MCARRKHGTTHLHVFSVKAIQQMLMFVDDELVAFRRVLSVSGKGFFSVFSRANRDLFE